MNPSPTIGRIVHFNRQDGDRVIQQAALVVAVHTEETVSLVVWNEHGTAMPERSVTLGPIGEAGRWSWPSRS